MIVDLVKEDLIQFNVEADNWEDVVIKAAQPLVDHEFVTENYVQSIIASAKESGPYFVLVPHVALPHARSETGALKDALGITVLSHPVTFGNESNDPVKYVFTLSALDSSKHLEALADLAGLFEDEAFFKLLDTTSSPEDVMFYLKDLHQ